MIPTSIGDVVFSGQLPNAGVAFPRWTNVRVAPSGSMLFGFLNAQKSALSTLDFYATVMSNRLALRPWLGEPRLGWMAPSTIPYVNISSVSVSGVQSLIRLYNEDEFIDSVLPCYYVIEDGSAVYFRNLCTVYASAIVSGSVSPPGDSFLKGENFFWSSDGNVWNIISPESNYVNYSSNYVTVPVTGAIQYLYGSSNMYSTLGSGSVNNGPYVQLTEFDYWTYLDEIGLTVSLPRIGGEDNWSYWSRLVLAIPFRGDSSSYGLGTAIGNSLCLLNLYAWDGVTSITFPASSQITGVYVLNLPQTGFVSRESLLPDPQGNMYAEKPDWLMSNIMYYGVLLNPDSTGSVSFIPAGEVVAVNSYVQADYSYVNYSVQSSGGCITQLNPTSNMTPGNYYFVTLRGMNARTVNSEYFKAAYLLDALGNPTPFYKMLVNEVDATVRITYGDVNWGKSYWFSPNEISPAQTEMPIPMDN